MVTVPDPIQETAVLIRQFLEAPDSDTKADLVEEICDQFSAVFLNQFSKFKECQARAAHDGFLEEVWDWLVTSPHHQEKALHALKWCCLDNRDSCVLMAQSADSFDYLIELLSEKDDNEGTSPRDVAALRFVNSISRMLWEEKVTLSGKFIPVFRELLDEQSTTDDVRFQIINFVFLMSCDDATHAILVNESTLVIQLAKVAKTGSHRKNYFGAALCVMNIIKTNPDWSGVFSGLEWRVIIQDTRTALERSLKGEDFPEGSRTFFTDWLVCSALHNICKLPELVKIIRSVNFLHVMDQGVAKYNPNSPFAQVLASLDSPKSDPSSDTIDYNNDDSITNRSFDEPESPNNTHIHGNLNFVSLIKSESSYFVLSGSMLKSWTTLSLAKELGFRNHTSRIIVTGVEWQNRKKHEFKVMGEYKTPVTWHLRAESAERANAWMEAIQEQVGKRSVKRKNGVDRKSKPRNIAVTVDGEAGESERSRVLQQGRMFDPRHDAFM
jgi:hypothetical protein